MQKDVQVPGCLCVATLGVIVPGMVKYRKFIDGLTSSTALINYCLTILPNPQLMTFLYPNIAWISFYAPRYGVMMRMCRRLCIFFP